MPPAPRKNTAPETAELSANSTEEPTPVYDEIAEEHKQDLESADPVNVTNFEEDDDPLSNVGELVADDDEKALKTEENA